MNNEFRSPTRPFFWPSYMRLAVTVGTDIPSPIKKITFFATFLFSDRYSLFRSERWESVNQNRSSLRSSGLLILYELSEKEE